MDESEGIGKYIVPDILPDMSDAPVGMPLVSVDASVFMAQIHTNANLDMMLAGGSNPIDTAVMSQEGIPSTSELCSRADCEKERKLFQQWKFFIHQRLINIDKLFWVKSAYENEKKVNVQLQLLLDQRNREFAEVSEQCATLLHEQMPTKDRLGQLEIECAELRRNNELMNDTIEGMRAANDQLTTHCSQLRMLAKANTVDILEKRLKVLKNRCQMLNTENAYQMSKIDEMKQYQADARSHFVQSNKRVYNAFTLAKRLLDAVQPPEGRDGSPSGISKELVDTLEQGYAEAQETVKNYYCTYRMNLEKKYKGNLLKLTAIPSLDDWLVDESELASDHKDDEQPRVESEIDEWAVKLEQLIHEEETDEEKLACNLKGKEMSSQSLICASTPSVVLSDTNVKDSNVQGGKILRNVENCRMLPTNGANHDINHVTFVVDPQKVLVDKHFSSMHVADDSSKSANKGQFSLEDTLSRDINVSLKIAGKETMLQKIDASNLVPVSVNDHSMHASDRLSVIGCEKVQINVPHCKSLFDSSDDEDSHTIDANFHRPLSLLVDENLTNSEQLLSDTCISSNPVPKKKENCGKDRAETVMNHSKFANLQTGNFLQSSIDETNGQLEIENIFLKVTLNKDSLVTRTDDEFHSTVPNIGTEMADCSVKCDIAVHHEHQLSDKLNDSVTDALYMNSGTALPFLQDDFLQNIIQELHFPIKISPIQTDDSSYSDSDVESIICESVKVKCKEATSSALIVDGIIDRVQIVQNLNIQLTEENESAHSCLTGAPINQNLVDYTAIEIVVPDETSTEISEKSDLATVCNGNNAALGVIVSPKSVQQQNDATEFLPNATENLSQDKLSVHSFQKPLDSQMATVGSYQDLSNESSSIPVGNVSIISLRLSSGSLIKSDLTVDLQEQRFPSVCTSELQHSVIVMDKMENEVEKLNIPKSGKCNSEQAVTSSHENVFTHKLRSSNSKHNSLDVDHCCKKSNKLQKGSQKNDFHKQIENDHKVLIMTQIEMHAQDSEAINVVDNLIGADENNMNKAGLKRKVKPSKLCPYKSETTKVTEIISCNAKVRSSQRIRARTHANHHDLDDGKLESKSVCVSEDQIIHTCAPINTESNLNPILPADRTAAKKLNPKAYDISALSAVSSNSRKLDTAVATCTTITETADTMLGNGTIMEVVSAELGSQSNVSYPEEFNSAHSLQIQFQCEKDLNSDICSFQTNTNLSTCSQFTAHLEPPNSSVKLGKSRKRKKPFLISSLSSSKDEIVPDLFLQNNCQLEKVNSGSASGKEISTNSAFAKESQFDPKLTGKHRMIDSCDQPQLFADVSHDENKLDADRIPHTKSANSEQVIDEFVASEITNVKFVSMEAVTQESATLYSVNNDCDVGVCVRNEDSNLITTECHTENSRPNVTTPVNKTQCKETTEAVVKFLWKFPKVVKSANISTPRYIVKFFLHGKLYKTGENFITELRDVPLQKYYLTEQMRCLYSKDLFIETKERSESKSQNVSTHGNKKSANSVSINARQSRSVVTTRGERIASCSSAIRPSRGSLCVASIDKKFSAQKRQAGRHQNLFGSCSSSSSRSRSRSPSCSSSNSSSPEKRRAKQIITDDKCSHSKKARKFPSKYHELSDDYDSNNEPIIFKKRKTSLLIEDSDTSMNESENVNRKIKNAIHATKEVSRLESKDSGDDERKYIHIQTMESDSDIHKKSYISCLNASPPVIGSTQQQNSPADLLSLVHEECTLNCHDHQKPTGKALSQNPMHAKFNSSVKHQHEEMPMSTVNMQNWRTSFMGKKQQVATPSRLMTKQMEQIKVDGGVTGKIDLNIKRPNQKESLVHSKENFQRCQNNLNTLPDDVLSEQTSLMIACDDLTEISSDEDCDMTSLKDKEKVQCSEKQVNIVTTKTPIVKPIPESVPHHPGLLSSIGMLASLSQPVAKRRLNIEVKKLPADIPGSVDFIDRLFARRTSISPVKTESEIGKHMLTEKQIELNSLHNSQGKQCTNLNVVQLPLTVVPQNLPESSVTEIKHQANFVMKHFTAKPSLDVKLSESVPVLQKKCYLQPKSLETQVKLSQDVRPMLEELITFKPSTQMWRHLLDRLLNRLHSQQQCVVREVIRLILFSDPMDFPLEPWGLAPKLFRLYTVVVLIEKRLHLQMGLLQERIVGSIFALVGQKKLWPPRALASMSAWVVSSSMVQTSNGGPPEPYHWYRVQKFLTLVMIRYPGASHQAILAAVTACKHFFTNAKRIPEEEPWLQVLYWVAQEGAWVGVPNVRDKLLAALQPFKAPHPNPLEMIPKFAQHFKGSICLRKNAMTSLTILVQWKGMSWTREKLIPKLRKFHADQDWDLMLCNEL